MKVTAGDIEALQSLPELKDCINPAIASNANLIKSMFLSKSLENVLSIHDIVLS